ncbi:MAG: hypothetical protein HY089_05345, partial [Ignavibacteriales bacterium]|nr:hypothetical protein [Ignavibacteriales bacterium]
MKTPYLQDHLPRTLLTIFLVFVVSIGAAGYFYYQSYVENIILITQEEFNAIAQLKVNQIEE